MIRPLAHQIRPRFFYAAADEGEGGGTAVLEAPAGGMGSAFSELSRQLREAPPEEKPVAVKPIAKEPAVERAEAKPAAKAPSAVPAEALSEPTAKPAAKAPEKPVEAKEDGLDTEALAKGMSEKGRENFKKLETHYQQRIEKIQRERDEAKSLADKAPKAEEATKLQTEHEALKAKHAKLMAEHQEISKTVELIGVERSPQFQAKYVRERAAIVDGAAKRVLRAGGDPKKFKEALEIDGPSKYTAIEEAMGDAPPFVQNQIAAEVSRIEALDEEKTQALADAKGRLSQWSEEETLRQRDQETKVLQAREARFGELIPEIARGCILARRVDPSLESAAAWNSDVDAIHEEAKHLLFNGTNFDEFAAAAYKSSAYDRMQGHFIRVRERCMELEKQVAAMTAAEPGASNGSGGGGAAPAVDDENLSFADRVSRGMAQSAGT